VHSTHLPNSGVRLATPFQSSHRIAHPLSHKLGIGILPFALVQGSKAVICHAIVPVGGSTLRFIQGKHICTISPLPHPPKFRGCPACIILLNISLRRKKFKQGQNPVVISVEQPEQVLRSSQSSELLPRHANPRNTISKLIRAYSTTATQIDELEGVQGIWCLDNCEVIPQCLDLFFWKLLVYQASFQLEVCEGPSLQSTTKDFTAGVSSFLNP